MLRIKVETLKGKTKVINTTTPQQRVIPPITQNFFQKYFVLRVVEPVIYLKKVLYCGCTTRNVKGAENIIAGCTTRNAFIF